MENLGSWSRCRSKVKVNSPLLDDLLRDRFVRKEQQFFPPFFPPLI